MRQSYSKPKVERTFFLRHGVLHTTAAAAAAGVTSGLVFSCSYTVSLVSKPLQMWSRLCYTLHVCVLTLAEATGPHRLGDRLSGL